MEEFGSVLELGGIGLDRMLETCVYFYFYLPLRTY
jgi:hypothetical protein